MSKKVLVPIANGTEELEAVAIIDVLRRAGAEVTVASTGGMQIVASRGVKLTADRSIGECKDHIYDLIALPGGIPGAENLRDCEDLIYILKKQKKENRFYAAICASPSVILQYHGLLENRRATCYPSRINTLENKEDAHKRVVIDGTCITSQGPGSSLEFALTLVRILFGKEKEKEVAHAMVMYAY